MLEILYNISLFSFILAGICVLLFFRLGGETLASHYLLKSEWVGWALKISLSVAVISILSHNVYDRMRVISPEEAKMIAEQNIHDANLRNAKIEADKKRAISNAKIRRAEAEKKDKELFNQQNACNLIAECIAKKISAKIESVCIDNIIKQTSFDYEWLTDYSIRTEVIKDFDLLNFYNNYKTAFNETIFSEYSWLTYRYDAIVMTGDKLKIQNENGVWQNYIYQCVISINTDRNDYNLAYVKIAPGRL